MILREKKSASQQSDSAFQKNQTQFTEAKSEVIEVDNLGEEIKSGTEAKNVKEPCLKSLPRYFLNPDDMEANDEKYEILFIDYTDSTGIDCLQLVKKDLQEVYRMHVYVPLVVDANWNLDQKCYNGFSGYEICHSLRSETS